MQKIEQKVPSNGDRCSKAATEGAPPTVTPALIKNAAAALAELMRQHESGGIHKVRPSTLSTLMSLQKLGEMSQSDDEVVDVNIRMLSAFCLHTHTLHTQLGVFYCNRLVLAR